MNHKISSIFLLLLVLLMGMDFILGYLTSDEIDEGFSCNNNSILYRNDTVWACLNYTIGSGATYYYNFTHQADGYFLYNDSTTIYYNETLLNLTIDGRAGGGDTRIKADFITLYNDSDTIYLNETYNNMTFQNWTEAKGYITSYIDTIWNFTTKWLYNDSTDTYFNETLLNETFQNWTEAKGYITTDTDTRVQGDLLYLYNDTDNMTLNETKLNMTFQNWTEAQGYGSGGIWSNSSETGVATYNGSINVTGEGNFSSNLNTNGNLTLGERITFALGGIIDNIVNDVTRIFAPTRINLESPEVNISGDIKGHGDSNITGNATFSGGVIDTPYYNITPNESDVVFQIKGSRNFTRRVG